MSWFKRKKRGIHTPTENKKDVPKGLWYKSPSGNIIEAEVLEKNFYVSPEDGYHSRIGSNEYFKILFDENKFEEIATNLKSKDPLKFSDQKKYSDRVEKAQKDTNLKDAIRVGFGSCNGIKMVIACMDFSFIGGSIGSVVGEKIVRGIDCALDKKTPFILISKSGGARMMEAAISLMQLAKTSAKLTELSKAKLPYISLLTDPTFGGATASFSMLGDLNISEPGALIGFAGPRVVKDTTGKDLPEGFQSAEFVLDKGFLDTIIERKDLKNKITQIICLLQNRPLGNDVVASQN